MRDATQREIDRSMFPRKNMVAIAMIKRQARARGALTWSEWKFIRRIEQRHGIAHRPVEMMIRRPSFTLVGAAGPGPDALVSEATSASRTMGAGSGSPDFDDTHI